ncbi:hypothetical protein H8S20_07100 [Clostridium sp. NSJ-6]|uniref:DUF1453 domain-containing protein n=1 Tax=Clostridium hominis TaxID=2763036 RepID=A0ABR7DCR8_9CLOT|nr:hypothetical protein [Clostridium hominis]MBC5628653.1 hypothetical protein [Clostridium hominis]
MRIFILFSNIIVPIIMICIGVLYNRSSNKKVNRILGLFMPIAVIGSGLGEENNNDFLNGINPIKSSNKKCGMIWFISGLATFIITIIVLMINKSDILSTTSFLDNNNVSVIMLEVEFAIAVMIFISTKFILKKDFYKKSDSPKI